MIFLEFSISCICFCYLRERAKISIAFPVSFAFKPFFGKYCFKISEVISID